MQVVTLNVFAASWNHFPVTIVYYNRINFHNFEIWEPRPAHLLPCEMSALHSSDSTGRQWPWPSPWLRTSSLKAAPASPVSCWCSWHSLSEERIVSFFFFFLSSKTKENVIWRVESIKILPQGWYFLSNDFQSRCPFYKRTNLITVLFSLWPHSIFSFFFCESTRCLENKRRNYTLCCFLLKVGTLLVQQKPCD